MLRCSFCGRESDKVIRVAIDIEYDRLTVRHEKKYACPECSRKKEAERKKKKEAIQT
jgi:ribosomal protein L37AE/L43A